MLARRRNVDGYHNISRDQIEIRFALPSVSTPNPRPRTTPSLVSTPKLEPEVLSRSSSFIHIPHLYPTQLTDKLDKFQKIQMTQKDRLLKQYLKYL